MKSIILIAFYTVFCTANLFADEKTGKKTDTTENVNSVNTDIVPDNKVLLENLINETRVKIEKDKKTIQILLNFIKQINDYKAKIDGVPDIALTNIYSSIKTINGDREKYVKFISGYRNITQQLYFQSYYYNSNNSDFDDLYNTIGEFRNNISSQVITSFASINTLLNDETKKTFSAEDYKTIETFIAANTLPPLKKQLSKICEDITGSINKTIDGTKNRLTDEGAYLAKLSDKYNQADTQINSLAIKLGLPLFCATILLLFLGPKLLKYLFKSTDDNDNNSQNLVEISTVLLLTMSILILGLSEKIKGDVLGTLIGGISGYVLNRINKSNSRSAH